MSGQNKKKPTLKNLKALFDSVKEMEAAGQSLAKDLDINELFAMERSCKSYPPDMKSLAIINIAEAIMMEQINSWKGDVA